MGQLIANGIGFTVRDRRKETSHDFGFSPRLWHFAIPGIGERHRVPIPLHGGTSQQGGRWQGHDFVRLNQVTICAVKQMKWQIVQRAVGNNV